MTTLTAKNDPLLDEDRVAEILGLKPQTLANWRCTKRYRLPFIKCGRLVRYRTSAVEAFLEENTVGASAE